MITVLRKVRKRCVWFWQAWLRATRVLMRRRLVLVGATAILCFVVAVSSFAPASTLAGSCSWNGSTSTDWHTGTNWGSGCTGTDGIPASGDDVTIPNGTLNYEPTISAADVSINSLAIESGRTLTLSSDRNLTVAGALTINSGGALTSSGSSSTVTVAGNWTNGGTFTGGTSTVVFSGAMTISSSGTSNFYNLTLNPGSGNTVSIAAGHTIYVAGDWTRSSGSFEPSTSTVVFDGGDTSTLTSSYAITFHNLTVGSGKTLSLTYSGNNLYIENTLSLSDASSTFNTNGRPVAFSNSSYTAVLAGAGTFDFGKLTINSGKTLNAGSTSINVSGDWVNNGTFTAGTGTVTFNGTGTQTVSGSTTFNDVTVNAGSTLQLAANANFGYAGTFTLDGSFDATTNSPTTVTIAGTSVQSLPTGATTLHSLTINSGSSLTAPSGNLSIAGDFTNNGAFTHNSGTVTLNGASEQTISSGSSVTAFNNLTVNSGATVVIPTTNTPTVVGTLTNNGALKQTQSVSDSSDIEFLNISTNKYYGVMINPGGNNLDSTTVTVYGNQTCPSPPGLGNDPIQRCFYIEPTIQLSATVKLYYLTSELNGNDASTLNIYHEKNGLWYLEEGTYTRESNGGTYDWVQVTGVDEYSPFTGGLHNEPTLLELASFTATSHTGHVLLEWEIASEVDNTGFNLWRSEAAEGEYAKLNAEIIPAQGGPTTGASYSYVDDAVTNGVAYWYKLEDVDLHGASTFHGPVSATSHRLRWIYLPLLLKGSNL